MKLYLNFIGSRVNVIKFPASGQINCVSCDMLSATSQTWFNLSELQNPIPPQLYLTVTFTFEFDFKFECVEWKIRFDLYSSDSLNQNSSRLIAHPYYIVVYTDAIKEFL